MLVLPLRRIKLYNIVSDFKTESLVYLISANLKVVIIMDYLTNERKHKSLDELSEMALRLLLLTLIRR